MNRDESILGQALNIIFRIIGLLIYVFTWTAEKIIVAWNNWLRDKLRN